MRYGTPVRLRHDGFLISPESLAPLGIGNESNCWGAWVPNRNLEATARDPNRFPHFFVSPFESYSWPVLFRIEIAIDGEDPLALAKAIGPITGEGMSILSIDVTPAGHRHSWATIIAEAIKLKAPGGIIEKLKKLPERRRTFRDPVTWSLVHSELAPEMLKKCKQLVSAVEQSDKVSGFLRAIFINQVNPDTGLIDKRFEKGVLYNWNELPEPIRPLGESQRTPSVRCTWMQNHAFFWLYKRTDPVELRYSGESRQIKIVSSKDSSFFVATKDFPPSSRLVAFIDLEERFLRVVLSPDDLRRGTARVTIPFSAEYDRFEGSKGFQHNLFRDLTSAAGLKIRHVSMATYERDLVKEKGELSLLVSSTDFPLELPPLVELRETVQQIASAAAKSLEEHGCNMNCDGVTVERFSSPLVFLSTRFDWIEGPASARIDHIKRLGEDVGLSVITGDLSRKGRLEEFVPTVRDLNSITDVIDELIRHCSAFVQIIPIEVLRGWRGVTTKAEEGALNWLLYELGAARALRVPCEILVDVRNAEADIGGWQRILKVGAGQSLRTFDSSVIEESLYPALSAAFEQLSLKVS